MQALFVLLISGPALAAAPPKVQIVKTASGWQLHRGGAPYFIRGAGVTGFLDRLPAAGGNSVRTWSVSEDVLKEAAAHGLTVCLGLPIGIPRHGFDYGDPAQVAAQKQETRETVLKLKDHPALLFWALGNELELNIGDAERIRLWKALNDLAAMIHELDPNHPVIAVLAGTGKTKLAELKEHCPALDAVGINAYGGMMKVPEEVASQGWDKAYIVTEFGPRGYWEVAKTPWGLPIEDTSTEKAAFYLKAYRHAVENRPNCLGSYVFLWGHKQEKTHTWFNLLFPDGSLTGAVDAITYVWTGKWPANRAPAIGPLGVRIAAEGSPGDDGRRVFAPGAKLRCQVDASDPDGDALTVAWDLRLDVSDNPSTGGDHEPSTPPIAGAVVSAERAGALIRLPDKQGNYRVFVYVRDGKGSIATANVALAARLQ